ncbi:MAG: HAMP domain-containing histidine kinase, partial [Acidobacteria bacterium]|nr:HAMP domain-containing histidine kinase [Acidobacteriota bacterium]
AQVTAFTRAPLDARGPVELGELARAAVDLRRFAATRAGLTLDYTLADGPVTVTGNAGALQQAILNLIITAEQALAGTRGRIAVAVGCEASGATVRIAGSELAAAVDWGGLAGEPFAVGRPPTDFSGLNLFAARAIARAHGGDLDVEAGAGFAVVLRVPALA